LKGQIVLKKVLQNTFFRFLLTGVLNTIFGYLIFCLFTYLIGNAYVSVTLSTIAAVLFNFRTYGKLVFKSHDNSKIVRFFAAYLFIIATQMVLLKGLAYFGITNPYLAVALLVLPMATLSFIILKKFVFHLALIPDLSDNSEK